VIEAPRLLQMTRPTRKATQQLVTVALLAFLAQALVPRASWYVHRHAGDGHEHVHGWDGTRVAGSTTSLRDFLPHKHDAGHAHGHDDGRATATRHGADAVAAHDHEHSHDHAHAAPAGSGRTRPRADGPVLAAAHDGAHAHAQAPFQTVARSFVKYLAPPLPHRAHAAPVLTSLSDAPTHAPRARGPPSPA
jgi:hypothetical protein